MSARPVATRGGGRAGERGGRIGARASLASWAVRIALLGIATAFSLGLGEVWARLYHHDIRSTADNSSFFARRTRYELNRAGFRGPEIGPPDGTTPVITVIGDSFAFGQGVRREDRFGDRLEALLRESTGIPHRVVTLARPGAHTEDELGILHDHALPLHPRRVVLQWFVNDVEIDPALVRPRPWPLVPSARVSGLLHRHSALYFLLRRAWENLQRERGWLEDYPAWLERTFRDPQGRPWRRAEAAFRAFVGACREHGVPLLVVLFPFLTGDPPDEVPAAYLMDRMRALCRDLGVRCLDLRPLFAGRSAAALRVNRFDGHPGPEAHRAAAEALFLALAREGDTVPPQRTAGLRPVQPWPEPGP